MMSQFRLGLKMFVHDLRHNNNVVLAGIIAAGAFILILSAITGYNFT